MEVAKPVDAQVRRITDAEVDAFHEQGWVFMPELISREVAGELLATAKRLMAADEGGSERYTWWKRYDAPRLEDPLFDAVATSSQIGENLTRLYGRDSSIRLLGDGLAVKHPSTDEQHGQPTAFHQDQNSNPFDLLAITVWYALDEITPDQGSMQFYTGSHKLGPLGHQPGVPTTSPSGKTVPPIPLEDWPRLMQCELSEPLHYRPGDATAHLAYTVHGTGPNATDRPRWTYFMPYFPGDALYTGLPSRATDDLGLEPLQPSEHPKFPEIYNPAN